MSAEHPRDPEALLREVEAAERAAHRGQLKIFLGYASGAGKSFKLFDEGRRRRERGEDIVAELLDAGISVMTSINLESRVPSMPTSKPSRARIRSRPSSSTHTSMASRRSSSSATTFAAGCAIVWVARHWTGSYATPRGSTCASSRNDGTVARARPSQGLPRLRGRCRQDRPDADGSERSEAFGRGCRHRVLRASRPERDDRAQRGNGDSPPSGDRVSRDHVRGNGHGCDSAPPSAGRHRRRVPTHEHTGLSSSEAVGGRPRAYTIESRLPGDVPDATVSSTAFSAETRERLLLVLTPDPSSAALIRRGRRVADNLRADCRAVYVSETPDLRHLSADERDSLERHLAFARGLHIDTDVLQGTDEASAIVVYARLHGVTQIFVTRQKSTALRAWFASAFVQRLVNLARDMQVTVVADRSAASASQTSY